MSFQSLGLTEQLIQSIDQLGFKTTFPIQEQSIPVILAGKDVMGIAHTGSGKTACFVIPILAHLLKAEDKQRDRNLTALVLVPTRELAIQIDEVFKSFTKILKPKIKSMAVYGGVSINPQMKALFGVEILVATPGRLLDLIENNAVRIAQIKHLVIDEADKLLNLGFEEEMNKLIALMPKEKQTTLFSATLNDKVIEMKTRLGIDPEIIEIKKDQLDLERINQIAYHVSDADKGPFLRYLIKEHKMEQVLVFVSSIRTADNLVAKLKKNKIKAMAIHGKKSQDARIGSLEYFKQKNIQVLVATDLIGRGIHIDSLPFVINYELPRSPLDYIHRIGRTGRASEKGQAITLLTYDDMHHFEIIQKKMGEKVEILRTEEINLKGF